MYYIIEHSKHRFIVRSHTKQFNLHRCIMIIIIDNTKNLEQAKMTPKIIKVLEDMHIVYVVVAKKDILLDIIHECVHIDGFILSGGPLCLTKDCHYDDIPVLGICFGFQVMCDLYGGKVSRLDVENKGQQFICMHPNNMSLLCNLPVKALFYFSHYDYIEQGPPKFELFKDISNERILGFESKDKKRFGFQFHPEGSEDGVQIIKNFINMYC